MRALAHDGLRFLGVVPEIGVFGERVQLIQADKGVVVVKDASSAAPATFPPPQPPIGFPRAWLIPQTLECGS
jgi:hypothetical protein